MLLNYGYAPTDGSGELDAEDDRFGRQLYAAVAGAADLPGKDVLEVGCGRGGGAAFVFEHFGPRSVTGLDLAKKAIDDCRAHYSRPGLEFVTGDAEALPFADQSFDVIITVESSHCYPTVPRFLAEAHRVLRPGGLLLLADFRRSARPPSTDDEVAALREQLATGGFRTLQERDITPNVVRALELGTPRIRARIERRVPKLLRNYWLEFAAVEGSAMYRAFSGGAMIYLSFVLERP